MIAQSRRLAYIVLLLGLGFAGGYWWGSRQGGASSTPIGSRNPRVPKTLWTCGMHPQVVRQEPGLCPICQMALVPLVPNRDTTGGVRVDPVALQALGVRLVEVERRPLEHRIRVPAELVVPDGARTVLVLKFEAYVERLWVRAEGEPVRQGQPVMELYSPELLSAQRELLSALELRERASSEEVRLSAERLLEAARARLRLWDVPEAFIEQLERTRQVQRTLQILAPRSGIVTRRMVTTGQRVMAGEPLLEISRLDPLWLLLAVYESDLPWVRTGALVEVRLPMLPGRTLRGVLEYRYPDVDPSSRTARVRVPLANPGLMLLPGAGGTAEIVFRSEPVVAVPEEAVLLSGARAFVLEAIGQGRFRPLEVRLGRRAQGYYEVLEGLKPGQQLAGGATFLIDGEAQLRAALDRLSGHDHRAEVSAKEPSSRAETVRTVRIALSTIQCEMCVETIQQAVSGLPGLLAFRIDLARREALAKLDVTRLSLSLLERVIARSGYTANRTARDPAAYERLPDCCKEPADQKQPIPGDRDHA
ncbi:MAG: efflux RND transporter periplasmic adaptor subunit [Bacteroidetes bacterium]|nr:efflux RND transporter periplasmic adaptor subunit [Bacteroidota bacterium]